MPKLTRRMIDELTRVAAMPDNQIDLSDAPDTSSWNGAIVGRFYRPIKKPLTIRIDADVVAWLKSQGAGYQTRINRFLREAMVRDVRRKKAS